MKLSTENQNKLKAEFEMRLLGEKLPLDIVESQTGEILIPARKKVGKRCIKKLVKYFDSIECDPSPLRNVLLHVTGKYLPKD